MTLNNPNLSVYTTRINLFRILQLSAITVLLGRAWQHLYWDAPYRTFFWDEGWMKWPVETLLGCSWKDYVTNPQTDLWIQHLIVGTGWFYLLVALAAVFVLRLGKWGRGLLWLASLSLLFLAALYCKEKFFFIGQFFEYTLQFSAPALLAIVAARPQQSLTPKLILFLKIAIALTFTCHGLYAIGFYPRPGYFVSMTMSILGISDAAAAQFLVVAGVLDFVISIAIFFPPRIARPALVYAIFWGFSTSLARVWAYFYWETWDASLLQWLHETVMRCPHFLGPLVVWGWYWNRKKQLQ